jgi:Kelch motif.
MFSESLRWSAVPVASKGHPQYSLTPYQRYGHSAVVHEGNIYIWGGRNDRFVCNKLFCFNCGKSSFVYCSQGSIAAQGVKSSKLRPAYCYHEIEFQDFFFFCKIQSNFVQTTYFSCRSSFLALSELFPGTFGIWLKRIPMIPDWLLKDSHKLNKSVQEKKKATFAHQRMYIISGFRDTSMVMSGGDGPNPRGQGRTLGLCISGPDVHIRWLYWWGDSVHPRCVRVGPDYFPLDFH